MVKKMLQDQSALDLTDISNVTGRLWQMATNQPPEKAIRMADVKAISECRMLTLEAKDFVELLLNHPECKHPVLRLMEQRAEVNKRNVQSALSLQHETQAPTHEELQLVKACWSQFGLFSCLDDETMLECAKCMMVCYVVGASSRIAF
jgi:CRP-like cAMP-binding protein